MTMQVTFGHADAVHPILYSSGLKTEVLTPSGSNQVSTIVTTGETVARVATTSIGVYVSFGEAPDASTDAGRVLVPANSVALFRVPVGAKAAIVQAVGTNVGGVVPIVGQTPSGVTISNGVYAGAGGLTVSMGASAAAPYSFAWGFDHQVNAGRVACFGEGHRAVVNTDYSAVFGYRCQPPFPGAHVASARQRGSVVGNNMMLDWSASQETTNTTATDLSVAGTANYPTQPTNSIVNGTVWVTGVSDAGVCSSFRIDFTSERTTAGGSVPALRANNTTTLHNGLSLPTVPTMNVTSGGLYRVRVVGLTGTNIRWDARFVGQQIVYT